YFNPARTGTGLDIDFLLCAGPGDHSSGPTPRNDRGLPGSGSESRREFSLQRRRSSKPTGIFRPVDRAGGTVMMARSLKAKILVFAVFFIGIATGIFIANFYQTRVTGTREELNTGDRAQRTQRDANNFHEYLGLNEEQQQQVNKTQ